jgi:hypothetical protein
MQTSDRRGEYESAFKPPWLWEGSRRTSQGQNRTREIRPSGIAGGPMETWVMGVGLRPCGKPPDTPPNPKAVARRRSIPTVAADKATVSRVQVPPYQFVRFGYVAMSRFMENLERSRRVTPCSLRDVNGPAALCFGTAVGATGGSSESRSLNISK